MERDAMSFNRENIVWRSKDGRWSIGFYETTWVGSESDGYDPEWDVEYDFDRFSWVSTGHPTEEAAHRAWDGANPGGSIIVEEYDPAECDKLDQMAAACKERNRELDRAARRAGRIW
jgi:hypothetical protein